MINFLLNLFYKELSMNINLYYDLLSFRNKNTLTSSESRVSYSVRNVVTHILPVRISSSGPLPI